MRKYILFAVLLISTIVISPVVRAQQQDFDFSGNSASSYQCFDTDGSVLPSTAVLPDPSGGFYCLDSKGSRTKAVLKPPTLQEFEILFVKVVYAIWAIVASFSFLMIIYLAYQYLISRGDVTQIKAIRERIIKFIIGFALVFLAVPILITFFKILGVDNRVQCYSGLTGSNNVGIGFQFFFTDLCTDPLGLKTDPCDITDLVNDIKNGGTNGRYACPTPKEFKTCSGPIGLFVGFCCQTSPQVWKASSPGNCK
ncbi:MAG: pilin [Candidatus Dojkabacteria bacterium]